MKTFLKICRKVKSGEPNGWVYGDFEKRYITYHILCAIKAKRIGINIY